MKKVLLIIGVFAITISAKAQTYFFETFDSQGAGWTNVDQDADGFKWKFVNYDVFVAPSNQETVASSASYDSGSQTPLTPDNFLTSPAITIGSTALTMSFKVKGQFSSFSQEHYAVYVTTSNTIAAITAATPVFEETLPNGTSTYLTRTADLSAFSGQTVYVTFRHFNVTNQFAINIDDVVVGDIPANEVAMLSTTVPSGALAGNISIKGTVRNYGTSTITSLDASYDAGAGAVNATIPSLNIAPGAIYTFTHPTPLAVSSGNTYNVNVCATITNDGVASNNCAIGIIDFVLSSPVVDKYIVVEEKTGTWCGNCPRGTVALNKLHANEPKAFEIAIHQGDPMVVSSYDSGSESFIDFDGYPYIAVDRVAGIDPNSVVSAVNFRKLTPAPASISFDAASVSGNTITITPKISMVATISGDFRLAVVLTEDNVKGTGTDWLQTNYYFDGSHGSLIDQNGTDWKTLPEYVDQSTVFGGYDHVARALANNAINGSAGSLPGTLTNGQSYTHTYTFTKDATWNIANMHAVAMLVKNSTGEVLNSDESAITGGGTTGVIENTATAFGVEVYPNPSNGSANVKVALENESTVSILVYNMIGEVVYQVPATTLAAGAHIYSVNLDDTQSGVYFAHVSVNGTNQVIKMNIVK